MRRITKRWVMPGIVFALGIAAGLYFSRPSSQPVWAGQNSLPGDLNGDDMVDVSDPVYLLIHLFRGGPPPVAAQPSVGPVSTVILVRHAERETVGEDPPLTPEGEMRAQRLAEILGPTQVDTLIASTLRRTQDTLAPLAAAKGLPILEITEEQLVVERIENQPHGSTTVIAHHSFTMHDILEGLGLEDTRATVNVSGSNYDNFLMVLLPAEGEPQLVHMKYGEG